MSKILKLQARYSPVANKRPSYRLLCFGRGFGLWTGTACRKLRQFLGTGVLQAVQNRTGRNKHFDRSLGRWREVSRTRNTEPGLLRTFLRETGRPGRLQNPRDSKNCPRTPGKTRSWSLAGQRLEAEENFSSVISTLHRELGENCSFTLGLDYGNIWQKCILNL